MRKLVFTMLAVLLVGAVIYGVSINQTATAAVTGACSGCHTMHNSQDGAAVDSTGPNAYLLRASCVGCHISPGAGYESVDIDDSQTAAGTFSNSVANSQNKRHDVDGIFTSADTVLGNNPPGFANEGQTNLFDTSNRLTCAGTNGCHGLHNNSDPMTAIKGNHHGANTGYRFLYNDGGSAIQGVGSTNRELGGATASNHNLYSSAVNTGISSLCAYCHGDFHGTDDTQGSSPFRRHPTDIAIGNASTSNAVVDYVNNPFGFDSFTGLSTTTAYTTTNAKVVCVSCHRAHGSDQPDILRFNYANQVAGGGGTAGCLGCHSGQR